MRRILGRVAILGAIMTLTITSVAWAHTTVSPEEVSAGSTEIFTVSTPGEKDIPIVEERVEIPEGFDISNVGSPDGWQGSVEGDSIVWSGGEIPQGEEQEFTFEAQIPDQANEYSWKAFDTYEDGSVSEWNGPEDSDSPASVTEVLAADSAEAGAVESGSRGDLPNTGGVNPLLYGVVAFGLLALGVGLRIKLRRN